MNSQLGQLAQWESDINDNDIISVQEFGSNLTARALWHICYKYGVRTLEHDQKARLVDPLWFSNWEGPGAPYFTRLTPGLTTPLYEPSVREMPYFLVPNHTGFPSKLAIPYYYGSVDSQCRWAAISVDFCTNEIVIFHSQMGKQDFDQARELMEQFHHSFRTLFDAGNEIQFREWGSVQQRNADYYSTGLFTSLIVIELLKGKSPDTTLIEKTYEETQALRKQWANDLKRT
jgi:hypothetical protein